MEASPMSKRWSVAYKKVVLDYADLCGCDAKSYREFNVPRQTFYCWRKAFVREAAAGLIPKKPVAKSHPRQLSAAAVEKITELRKSCHQRTAEDHLVPCQISRDWNIMFHRNAHVN
jgi:hypothetical protein